MINPKEEKNVFKILKPIKIGNFYSFCATCAGGVSVRNHKPMAKEVLFDDLGGYSSLTDQVIYLLKCLKNIREINKSELLNGMKQVLFKPLKKKGVSKRMFNTIRQELLRTLIFKHYLIEVQHPGRFAQVYRLGMRSGKLIF